MLVGRLLLLLVLLLMVYLQSGWGRLQWHRRCCGWRHGWLWRRYLPLPLRVGLVLMIVMLLCRLRLLILQVRLRLCKSRRTGGH